MNSVNECQDRPTGVGGETECSSEEVETKAGVASSDAVVFDFRNDDNRKCFTCCYCGRKFARRQTMEQHERIHTGEKPFRCSECNKCFRQRSALRVHRKCHTGDKAFECFVCCKRFYRSGDLKAHLGIHTGMREYSCPVCSKGFGRPSDLRRHLQTHEADPVLVDLDKSPHECPRCGKKFTRRAQVEIHQRVHTGEKPYQCAQCGENFRWRQNFRAHQRNHTCEKPYHCSDCDRRFTCLSALEKHQILLHSGLLLRNASSHQGSSREDARHQCCQCGKSFHQAKDLLVHQRVHTGEKPYKCSQCEKRFRQIGHVKEHQRVHSGEKPYQCSVCYKCFPYSQSMKKHLRVVHRANQRNTEEKDFSLLDDVEEVKICSAPSSPSSKLSDDSGAPEDLTQHIKTEDSCLPLVEREDGLAPASMLCRYSGVSADHSHLIKAEESRLVEDADNEVSQQSDPEEKTVVCISNDIDSSPTSPSSKQSDDPGATDELRRRVKTEQTYTMEDGSAFSCSASELSEYPDVFEHITAHQVKSEEKCLRVMDNVGGVKIGSAPVGAL